MSLLRYFLVDSLTNGGQIVPTAEDARRINLIYATMVLQLSVCYLGSALLFYFIIQNWFWSAMLAVLFTFVYYSISLVLFSGLRMSSYLTKTSQKHTQKSVIIGKSNLEVNEVSYEQTKSKKGLISALILRLFFIVVFGFFIFSGLVLGISLYNKPSLDVERGLQIIHNFETKNGAVIKSKSKFLALKLSTLVSKRAELEKKYLDAVNKVKLANDETHKILFTHDIDYFNNAISDWDFLHQHELYEIPLMIKKLQKNFEKDVTRLKFITEHKKFGVYRINEFKQNNGFAFFSLFFAISLLFILPFGFRFNMIRKKSNLDIALEEKIVNSIKNDYRNHHQEMLYYYKKFGAGNIALDTIYDEAPIKKKKYDDGQIVAVKNQMNVFLNHQL